MRKFSWKTCAKTPNSFIYKLLQKLLRTIEMQNGQSGHVYRGVLTERSNTAIRGNDFAGNALHGSIEMMPRDLDGRMAPQ